MGTQPSSAAHPSKAFPQFGINASEDNFPYLVEDVSPWDFATIYNVGPVYAAGTDGSGVKLAIVGRTHIGLADVATFRSQFGLPANPPTVVVNGTDPGDLGDAEDGEGIDAVITVTILWWRL